LMSDGTPRAAVIVEEDARVALGRLLRVAEASFEDRAHLKRALDSRIVIEQAKGVLAERLRLTVDEAFALLRRAARSSRRRIHELAADVVAQPHTPAEIVAALHDLLRDPAIGITKRSFGQAD
jgi:AmiR/NasT family two-component response regulator